MEKKDRRSKTGEGGGRGAKWTEVDELVLDIVGKDSAVVEGLPGFETWRSREEVAGPPLHLPGTAEEAASHHAETGRQPEEAARQPQRTLQTRRSASDFLPVFRRKKLVKVDLEIENLQFRNALLRRQLEEQPICDNSVITDGDLSLRSL